MGKKQREKKAAKLEIELEEKKQIELRKQEKMTPIYRNARRLTIAVLITVFILYLGVVVNNRLPDILVRLAESS